MWVVCFPQIHSILIFGDTNVKLGTLGVKAVEMEASALYYLAAKYGVQALGIMTISDSLVNSDEDTTAQERQTTFTDMMTVEQNPYFMIWQISKKLLTS